MFQKLVSHNPDIKELLEKGYSVALDSSYLIVRDIPYLDNELALCSGAFVTKLVFIDADRVCQEDHQVFFAGSIPYNLDGTPIPNLAGGATTLALSKACADVVVQRSFSNKPRKEGRFVDFFEKIESYTAIISGPAIERYGATPYTYREYSQDDRQSVFKFSDTLTSRAEISDLSERFSEDVIAIIGLGGTGSYVLDFVVKTPVKEIRCFDHDTYYVHNAFRSPGALVAEELGQPKATILAARYENFRTGISAQNKYIDESSTEELTGTTFAFVCVDNGEARSKIFDILISLKIPFIDVGMGLKRKGGPIGGMIRTTYFAPETAAALKETGVASLAKDAEGIYRTNVQIGELNALNAGFAVMRFKQLRGFYLDDEHICNLLLDLADMKSVGDSASEV